MNEEPGIHFDTLKDKQEPVNKNKRKTNITKEHMNTTHAQDSNQDKNSKTKPKPTPRSLKRQHQNTEPHEKDAKADTKSQTYQKPTNKEEIIILINKYQKTKINLTAKTKKSDT